MYVITDVQCNFFQRRILRPGSARVQAAQGEAVGGGDPSRAALQSPGEEVASAEAEEETEIDNRAGDSRRSIVG